MFYVNRMKYSLICASIFTLNYCAKKESEIKSIEREETVNNRKEQKSVWLNSTKELMDQKSGTFQIKDKLDLPVIFEWQVIDPKSLEFTQEIKQVSHLLVDTYTQMELDFTKKYPNSISNEYFLKTLEPLFKSGLENVDWKLVEDQIKSTFDQFFANTDFSMFAGKDEFHLFVFAKNIQNGEYLGFIQFLITPEYQDGTIKIAYFGVSQVANKYNLEHFLIASVFKLIPNIKRLFLHTRVTNQKAIDLYYSLGFKKFAGNLPNWIDLEYTTDKTDILQNIANKLN